MEFDYKMLPLKLKTEIEIRSTDVKGGQMDETVSLIKEIEEARTNYFRNRLLLKAIKQASCESNTELIQITPKVQQIITSENISRTISIFNLEGENRESLNILGITDRHNLSGIALSYCEKIKFNSVAEEKLLSNCFKIKMLEWKKANETPLKVRNSRDIFSSEKIELLRSADSQFLKMYENLSLYRNPIKDLIEMRLGLLETVKSIMIPLFEVRCECLELEAKILERQILIHMFSENCNLPEAAKRICDASQKEYIERKLELEKLRRDEEAYNDLSGTEYDDILKKYKRYKKEIECMNWLATELS